MKACCSRSCARAPTIRCPMAKWARWWSPCWPPTIRCCALVPAIFRPSCRARCPSGRTQQRIKGWMGRADQTTKVRGMLVHPSQVADVVRRHAEILRARVVIEGEMASDRLTLQGRGVGATRRPGRCDRHQRARHHQVARRGGVVGRRQPAQRRQGDRGRAELQVTPRSGRAAGPQGATPADRQSRIRGVCLMDGSAP